MRWYVGQTIPQGEETAMAELKKQHFEAWWPRFQRRRFLRGQWQPETFSLFPGYVFIRLDLGTWGWRSVNGTRGMRHLLPLRSESPLALPDGVVDGWRMQAGPDGLIQAGDPEPWRPERGDRLRLVSGPLVGLDGLCVASTGERIKMMLDILGGKREIIIRLDQVERSAKVL